MLIRIFLGVSIFTTGLLFAQTKDSNPDRETFNQVQNKGESKKSKSASEIAVIQKLGVMEKDIASKVSDLEKLQLEASEFNSNLQKEMVLINEKSTVPISGHEKFLVSHHVEYSFEGGSKVKEIRVISKHKSLTNDMNSIIKVVTFVPGNLESIKVKVDKLDTRVKGITEVENYKDFAPEAKLKALKTIDSNLQNTIYRLDTFIQRNKITKNEKNREQLEGL